MNICLIIQLILLLSACLTLIPVIRHAGSDGEITNGGYIMLVFTTMFITMYIVLFNTPPSTSIGDMGIILIKCIYFVPLTGNLVVGLIVVTINAFTDWEYDGVDSGYEVMLIASLMGVLGPIGLIMMIACVCDTHEDSILSLLDSDCEDS